MDELKTDVKNLLIALLPDESENDILTAIVDRAVKSYMSYVNYPPDVSDEDKFTDMTNNEYCIVDLALYYFNKQGADFETNHSENGVSRTYASEGSIYTRHGIVPYARV